MPTLRPLRDIDQHDVLNYFAFNPTGTYPATKGNFVKILSGWSTEQQLAELGNPGAAFPNSVSQRYGIQPFVVTCTNSGDNAIGCMLYDVRETDENGERLIFKPDKAAKMQAVLSGQAVPIVTRGVVLYSGVNGGNTPVVGVTAGAAAYLASDGGISTTGALNNAFVTRVGTFLGPADKNGWVLLKIIL